MFPVFAFLTSMDGWLAGLGLSWVAAAIDILLAFLAAHVATVLVRRMLTAILKRRAALHEGSYNAKRAETAARTIADAAKYIFFFLAIAAAIGELGLSGVMNSMLAAAGIGTLALGLGAQSLIGDVTTGFLLLFEDAFAVGDYVTIGDISGTVENITLRCVTLAGWRGEKHIIPNSQIKILTNYTRADYFAQVDVDVSYESDADKALDLMMEEAAALATELGPDAKGEPQRKGVVSLGQSGVTLRVVLLVEPMRHWAVEWELQRRIKARFAREGIEIPYNRLVVIPQEPKCEKEQPS